MKNFINICDHSSNDLRFIIDEAKARKLNRKNLKKSEPDEDKPFEGKSMAMIFEKPSTRTRMSFDIAVKQLGGSSIKDFSSDSGKKGLFQQHFNVYGKEGEKCSNTDCNKSIIRIFVSNRSTFFCKRCQK